MLGIRTGKELNDTYQHDADKVQITRRDFIGGGIAAASAVALAGSANATVRRGLGSRLAVNFAGGGGGSELDVCGSVYGNGSNRCIFTSSINYDYKITQLGLTITIWAKFSNNTRGHFCTFGGDAQGISIGHGSIADNGVFGNYINARANSRWWLSSKTNISDEKWHHYAVVIDDPNDLLYVDGHQVATARWAKNLNDITPSGSNLTLLGVYDGSSSRYLTGFATRYCVYNEPKTSSFILEDFNLKNLQPNMQGLIHYYNGLKSQDNKLVDIVGGCNMSALNGAQFSNEIPE